MERVYIAIDLKSFYASVECVERGLDPMTTHLVVADWSRTEKTICLAVSPSLKAYGLPGRARLFEVVQKVEEINALRRAKAPGRTFTGASADEPELRARPDLALGYVTAPPQMAHYMDVSTKIYQIYLRHIAPEDIHVYSVDEVFIDATGYLAASGLNARELAMKLILEVLNETGITATAGIGTNLYLCKVAMDIGAKHIQPDENGVRIAELDEMSYRRTLWAHRPLTDFWRVGRGYAKKLETHGLYTMGDIARCSVGKSTEFYNEELLYRLFGVNAQLLIDHAWGWESCTMADIKAYRPASNSLGSGQVLQCPYESEKAKLVLREMADQLALDLLEKRCVTDQLVLTVGYDIDNLTQPELRAQYHGPVSIDRYGRRVPKSAHGTAHLPRPSSSARQLIAAALELYERQVDERLLVRRLYLTACHVIPEAEAAKEAQWGQLDLFSDQNAAQSEQEALERERRIQETLLTIKKKFGKNAVLKGLDLEEGATARMRNDQIGGHKA